MGNFICDSEQRENQYLYQNKYNSQRPSSKKKVQKNNNNYSVKQNQRYSDQIQLEEINSTNQNQNNQIFKQTNNINYQPGFGAYGDQKYQQFYNKDIKEEFQEQDRLNSFSSKSNTNINNDFSQSQFVSNEYRKVAQDSDIPDMCTLEGQEQGRLGDSMVLNESNNGVIPIEKDSEHFLDDQECIQLGDTIINDQHIINIEFNLGNFISVSNEEQKPHKLQIYSKTYTNQGQNRVIIIKGEYLLPSNVRETVQFFEDFKQAQEIDKKILDLQYIILKNEEEQEKDELDQNCQQKEAKGKHTIKFTISDVDNQGMAFNNNIDRTYVINKTIQQLMFSVPRQFCYLRKVKQMDKECTIVTEACESINYQKYIEKEIQQNNTDNIKGNIIKQSSSFISADKLYGSYFRNQTVVRFYQEIDYKANLQQKLMQQSVVSEYTNFVDRVYQVLSNSIQNK